MNFIPTLIKNCRIPIGKQQFYNSTRSTIKKDASVAVILRVDPNYNKQVFNNGKFDCKCGCKRNDHKEKCINSFIQQSTNSNDNNNNNNHIPLEILYLKRYGSGDRGGEICFPGGKIEIGETEQEAAERETQEEVQIDLTNPYAYTLIGKLDDKSTFDKIGVHSFVYLQLSESTPTIKLSEHELVDYGWVSIDFFLQQTTGNKILTTSVSEISTSRRLKKSLFLNTICKFIKVPYTYLPIQSSYEYKLWGLTLEITSDLLKKMTGRSPIPQYNQINNKIIFTVYKYPKSILFSIFSIFMLSVLYLK